MFHYSNKWKSIVPIFLTILLFCRSILRYSVSFLFQMPKHYNTFRDYTCVLSFNTTQKCFISLTKGIALQHISCWYYCFVPLNYTITKSVTYKYDTIEPMEWTQRSIALLFEEYKILLRLSSWPVHFKGDWHEM